MAENGRGRPSWLARWRDFVEAGLHGGRAPDMPWILPEVSS